MLRLFLMIEHFLVARPETVSFWLKEIRDRRALMFKLIRKSDSLKSGCSSLYSSAWDVARLDAVMELADLDVEYNLRPDFDSVFLIRECLLPSDCPYLMEQVTGFDLAHFDSLRHPSYSDYPPPVSLVISKINALSDDFSN